MAASQEPNPHRHDVDDESRGLEVEPPGSAHLIVPPGFSRKADETRWPDYPLTDPLRNDRDHGGDGQKSGYGRLFAVRRTERRQAIAIHGQINQPWVRDKGMDPVPEPSGRKGNIATQAKSAGRQAQYIETS